MMSFLKWLATLEMNQNLSPFTGWHHSPEADSVVQPLCKYGRIGFHSVHVENGMNTI